MKSDQCVSLPEHLVILFWLGGNNVVVFEHNSDTYIVKYRSIGGGGIGNYIMYTMCLTNA